jgi:hypothetical protein
VVVLRPLRRLAAANGAPGPESGYSLCTWEVDVTTRMSAAQPWGRVVPCPDLGAAISGYYFRVWVHVIEVNDNAGVKDPRASQGVDTDVDSVIPNTRPAPPLHGERPQLLVDRRSGRALHRAVLYSVPQPEGGGKSQPAVGRVE